MKHFQRTTKKHLGELLVERGVINRDQLNKALEYSKTHIGLIGEILVELKFATEKDIAQALTCQYGFPYLPLVNYEIEPDVVTAVARDICEKYCLVPIDKIGRSLTIAMANPLNVEAQSEVEGLTGCNVQAFVSTSTDIKLAIEKYYTTN